MLFWSFYSHKPTTEEIDYITEDDQFFNINLTFVQTFALSLSSSSS